MAIMKGSGVIEPTVSWGWREKEIPEPGPFEALKIGRASCRERV